MSKTGHTIYIMLMVLITVFVTVYLSIYGYHYYSTPMEDRFYASNHDWFKSSGLFGQGLGVIGTFLILFGVVTYILRKRYNFMGKYIRLKYLLEFHIFLCTLGPIMILFHTAFKFGGIVSVAFWSMVAVVLSGVIGRFIYIQIPRTIEGRELSLNEVREMKSQLSEKVKKSAPDDLELGYLVTKATSKSSGFFARRKALNKVRTALKNRAIVGKEQKSVMQMVKEEMSLAGRIERLQTMQRFFKYWHVAHLPFALIMLIIVVLHVGVSIAFGYTWIF